MAVSIGTSRTISGDTFYKNRDFDISFSIVSSFVSDASLYFGNSTYGVLPYVDSNAYLFRAASNTITTTGSLGTLSVDVVAPNPTYVVTATSNNYPGAAATCVDASGFVYFTSQRRVFQLDPSTGSVQPFAGTGVAGTIVNGPRLSAVFNELLSITTDGSGTFYLTEVYRLRKIDSNGQVSSIAGGDTQGYFDGTGVGAQFRWPNACVIRPNGDVLVTDSDNHCIRNVTPVGVVTTYAGKGQYPGYVDGTRIPTASFTTVHGVQAVGPTLYDTSNDGVSWTTDLAGTPSLGTVWCALALSNSILYGGSSTGSGTIAYQANGRIRTTSSIWNYTYGPAARALATNGTGTIVGGGTLTISSIDFNSQPWRSLDDGITWDVVGGGNVMSRIEGVAYGNGVWIVAGYGSNNGSIDSSWNLLRTTDASAYGPWTLTSGCKVQSINAIAYGAGRWIAVGSAYIAGYSNAAYSTDDGVTWTAFSIGNAQVRAIAYANGTWVAGGEAATAPLYYSTNGTTFTAGTGVTADYTQSVHYSSNAGRWFASVWGSTTSNIATSTDGASWSFVANASASYPRTFVDVSYLYSDISADGARFNFPCGITYDSNQTLYVADAYNNRIRTISNDTVATYAGNGTNGSSAGTLLTSSIGRPTQLTFDGSGSLYIVSGENQDVRKLQSNAVSTHAGLFGSPGYVDGNATDARFNGPSSVSIAGGDLFIGDLYNGYIRRTRTYPEVRPGVPRVPASGTIIATSNYPITINSRIDVCWTSVGGLLPLFKFEPFSNSFTANRCGGGTYGTNDILTYGTSSTELIGFLSGTGTTSVPFRGPNGPSTAYTYPLTLTVNATSNGTVVDSASTSVTISPARIIYTPCNANLVFYRNEPSPAPVFSLVAADVCLMYSATSLPTGLGFTRTGARTVALTGTPTVQTIGSNYTIVATDTSGRTYSTQVSMVVNPERLLLDVSGTLTQSNLQSTAPISPITFTSRFPPYGGYRAMRYSWSPPPPSGLDFLDLYGNAIAGSTYSVDTTYDASFTLTLAGTLTESQLRSFALTNTSNYSITVTGARTSPLPSLSPSLPRTITLQFGETIFFTSNVPPFFVGLDVSDYAYTAKTYFPVGVDTSITDIAVTSGFIPDGLDGSFTFIKQQFAFSGAPTTAATYPFTLTATNGAGTTASLSVAPTILNDSVTITALSGNSFTFIQTRSLANAKSGFYPSPIQYSVSALSGRDVSLTGANLPAGVFLVSNTGTYDLSGRPTTATGASTATLTAFVPATGASATKSFTYSVSAETFFFSDASFALIQNVPMTPVAIDVSTLSENPVFRFSAPSLPTALQITNTGLVSGTLEGGSAGTFDVTAFTAYSSGSETYSYTATPDKVLLQPSVYQVYTAPGCNVSVPITGYSLSATTVSNYRFQDPFLYGLTVNPTTGLLSGTLASALPQDVSFTVLGSAGIVDGTLVGTMTTANLTTNRAQMIEMRATSNLYIYYSDDNGITWSDAYSQSNLLASRIGTNGSNVYLVPTSSSTVLRSTTGSSFSTVVVSNSVGYDPRFTAVVNKPGTSTWWIAGTLSNGSRSAYVFKSTDDGLTWPTATEVTTNGFTDREGNPASYTTSNAYLNGGVSLAYKDGVLLLGGNQVLRSEDEGATWSAVSTGLIEVADFSVDQETVWLAVGSSLYPSPIDLPYMGDATTIVYSLDQGATWSPAVSPFVRNAYQVLYARGAWMVVGLTGTSPPYTIGIYASFDAINWSPIVFPPVGFAAATDVYPSGPLAPIGFDETDWKLGSVSGPTLYSHPYDTPLLSGWTSTPLTGGSLSGVTSSSRFYSYVAQTIDPGPDSTVITFPLPNTGPTFVSPAQSTYVLWQYMPIPTITFTATGTAPISYFVSPLPVGLTWNSMTHSVSGSCMRLGTQSFTVYAVDGADGVTSFTMTLIVEVPRIIKKQSGAGAYTALVRDYTEVAAAINARDTRVNPTEEAALGSFASPYAPDVVTPSNCPC